MMTYSIKSELKKKKNLS